jgi:succinyl-CoA synthetase beta subunit
MILSYQKQKEILTKYQITEDCSEIVFSEKEAQLKAEEIGYPLVMKISSVKHLHRSEVGGVVLDIKNSDEVKNAFEHLIKIEDVEGVIIQEKISGAEFIVGGKIDESFGPIVMLGSGGVMVEILDDVVFFAAPITKEEGEKMIEKIKGKKLLEGFRGKETFSKDHLIDVLLKTSNLITSKKVTEVEFNPVIINEKGAFVCDVKIQDDRENI